MNLQDVAEKELSELNQKCWQLGKLDADCLRKYLDRIIDYKQNGADVMIHFTLWKAYDTALEYEFEREIKHGKRGL